MVSWSVGGNPVTAAGDQDLPPRRVKLVSSPLPRRVVIRRHATSGGSNSEARTTTGRFSMPSTRHPNSTSVAETAAGRRMTVGFVWK